MTKVTIEAYEDCRSCHGDGYVTDWVPYWGASVPMRTPCDTCIERAYVDERVEEGDEVVDITPAKDLARFSAPCNK